MRVDLKAVRANFKRMQSLGRGCMAVIKADAYGHGLLEVARGLSLDGVRMYAVGAVSEGVRLREAGLPGRILSLLGPQDMREAKAVAGQNLLPLIYRLDQLQMLAEATAGRPQQIAIKLDTGMRRLGFTADELPALLDQLRKTRNLEPVLAMSHLATADEPESEPFVREQAARFQECRALFERRGLNLEYSLVNSAGLMAYPDLHFDLQRPGISLYGVNPFQGTAWADKGRGLQPTMTASAPVLQVHPLRKGEAISYGRTFTAEEDLTVAIVAMGYADGVSRGLSNKSYVCLHGQRARILGRVCMQLTAVDVTRIPQTQPGDAAWILGGSGAGAITANDLAGWWDTIPYEVFCLLGLNRRG
ncbi:alanine racemase [Megalodesulfovibrio paquesii]